MCKGEYLSHILRKSSTQIYAICVIYALIKSFGVKLYSILHCFSKKFMQLTKKFTRPPVALVAPNINSGIQQIKTNLGIWLIPFFRACAVKCLHHIWSSLYILSPSPNLDAKSATQVTFVMQIRHHNIVLGLKISTWS